MESKSVIMSALGVGIGVGVGIGLASGQTVGKWTGGVPSSAGVTSTAMEQEMLALIVNGKDSKVTFDQFPYYLSEQTRVLLSSAAFVHLKKGDIIKHTRNLSPASRTILLSGPAELYQQMLAKALAHYFGAELLLLDVNDFSLKSFKRSISESTLGRMSELFGSFSMLQPKEENKGIRRQSSGVDLGSIGYEGLNPEKLRRNASASANINDLAFPSASTPATSVQLKRESSWSFDEKLFIQTLYKVLAKESKIHPVILYLRDVEKLLGKSQRVYVMFQKMLKRLSGPILILGSRIVGPENDYNLVDEKISAVFPYNIEIKPPVEENHLVSWKSQLEDDMKMIQFQDNKNHIMEVLAANDLDCDDLGSLCFPDTNVLSTNIEEIVVSAITYHLTNCREPQYRNGKLVISSTSLSHGLSIFQKGKFKSAQEDTLKLEVQGEMPKVTPDNEFEKRIRPEVIPAKEIGVTFADIGALDDIKESLQELILLPLRRPDLFKGGLLKPCRGILLFGPPGTGKTMLAKAIANEAGASFINVSMSTITSKWFGEDEKNVRALFSVAAKVSPTIIFVDEVDSMLGQRNRAGEHEAMRKIKNEFMTHWDGLLSKPGERILVLAATNRPFDLDEAIIRRFERRIMVGLPSVENREKILRTLLSKENVEEGLDFTELARMTEGYSGSDLKNLCITAAYRPVRELIQQESLKDKEKKQKGGKGEEGNDNGKSADKKERVITIRPLNMEDLKEAKNQVAASFAAEGSIMNELKQWNESFGEGGSRKKEQLSYFL
ncbi:P-loop containing nucleoside triphosphate hydrolases superfamily protein [Striga hermonthica]|uniref:P-loop containing nucleoside triphosphate hydrolases superfamily protein n=1 Tax=Striga hermonthica TaxID=68872 RepID=A0A9N7NX89_STRHE|nr:P-loop containing nucleoside triphosphate hydrolases superfamily protein [Striga hermonthica]